MVSLTLVILSTGIHGMPTCIDDDELIDYPYLLLLCRFNAHNRTGKPTARTLSTLSSSRCPMCGTNKKSGKLSCCARGGAWFRKCGDVRDTTFDHTWADGVQACRGFVGSVSATWATSLLPVVLRHVRVVANPLNTAQPRNATEQQTNISRAGNIPPSREPPHSLSPCIAHIQRLVPFEWT